MTFLASFSCHFHARRMGDIGRTRNTTKGHGGHKFPPLRQSIYGISASRHQQLRWSFRFTWRPSESNLRIDALWAKALNVSYDVGARASRANDFIFIFPKKKGQTKNSTLHAKMNQHRSQTSHIRAKCNFFKNRSFESPLNISLFSKIRLVNGLRNSTKRNSDIIFF